MISNLIPVAKGRAMPLFGGRSAALRAEPPSGVSVLRTAATIAGDLTLALFVFAILFGLPGLFAGV